MTTKTLRIEQLSTGYGARAVIREVTLAPIKAGEITALVGPNAAGKSTLLRAIAGLLPARGKVLFGDADLPQLSARARADLVGFMPQTMPQAADLTILDGMLTALNVGRPQGNDPAMDQALDALEQVGIAHLALELLYSLSGGQRQLASLAQSIVRQPPVLLLDEPTSALDLGHQFDVMSMVRRYVDGGRIAVVVLHDLTFAARWADNVVVLKNGEQKSAGPPEVAMSVDMLRGVYGVDARIEQCSKGFLQITVDGREG